MLALCLAEDYPKMCCLDAFCKSPTSFKQVIEFVDDFRVYKKFEKDHKSKNPAAVTSIDMYDSA